MTTSTPNTFEMGMAPLALVCMDEPSIQQIIVDALAGMGFEVHKLPSSDDAGVQLQTHPYRLVVLSEQFGGGEVESNPMLNDLANLPIERRREAFVVMVGAAMESRSTLHAFIYSVDLVLSYDDLVHFRTLVGRGIGSQDSFYAPFKAVNRMVRGG